MAHKSVGKSIDSTVVERRLRPIYDSLDGGYNKRAVQEADKAIRKQPDLLCAQVLKSLALLRLGKEEECKFILNKVVDSHTSDDATLQALTICFRELQLSKEICKIYEHATKAEPNNDELLSHLFMSYVRVGDFKKQRTAGMSLYKLTNYNPYYYWTVMSIVMESTESTEKTVKNVVLQVATRMMDNFFLEGKIESAEEFMLYIFILELQEDSGKILEILDSPDIQKINQRVNYIESTKALHLVKMGRFNEAAAVYQELLGNQPDNWQYYECYIDTVIEHYKTENDKQEILLKASDYLKSLAIKSSEEETRDRSPWLGTLHLLLKLKELNLQHILTDDSGTPVGHVLSYVERIGDKTCCYGDIVNFLPLIQSDEIPDFLSRVKTMFESDSKGIPVSIRDMHRHQLWLQLCISLGNLDSFTADDHLAWADSVVSYYFETRHFSKDMKPTDIRPNDTYLIMAAQSYLTAFDLSARGDDSLQSVNISEKIIDICTWMEYGLELSKANFQLKLLLIKTYNLIGAPNVAKNAYQKLELKHIQFDTLGYVMTLQSMDLGLYTLAEEIFASSLKFFMSHGKETADSIIMAYKYGSLTRIPEFIKFQKRLTHSMQFATVVVENMVLAVTQASTDMKDVIRNSNMVVMLKCIEFSLIDNRDLDVMNNWLPRERKLSKEQIEETYNDEICIMKMRFCIMKILYASSEINDNNDRSSQENSFRKELDLNSLVVELEKLQTICDTYKTKSEPQMPLQAPNVPRIYSYSKYDYNRCFLLHAQLVANLVLCTSKPEEYSANHVSECKKLMENLLSEMKCSIDKLQTDSSKVHPCGNREFLINISYTIQTISFVSLLICTAHSLLVYLKRQKKSKKKKGSVSLNEKYASLVNYITWFIKKLQEIEAKLCRKRTSETVPENIMEKFNEMSFESATTELPRDTICASIEYSLIEVISCFLKAISGKIKFINAIKL